MMQELRLIGAGLATMALAGAGVGLGNIFSSLIVSVARRPSQKRQLFNYAIIGRALTEAIALFALVVRFILLFVM